MRRSVRYVCAAVVGVGALAVTLVFDHGSPGLLLFIPLLYGTAAAITLDNVETMRAMSEGWSPKIGALGGGIGAGTGVGLFRQSFAAGVAGQGLFTLGIVLTLAAVADQTNGEGRR